MSQYEPTGQESAGKMQRARMERHHIVCHDCDFEEVVASSWSADTIVAQHADETAHAVETARIE